jgi:hypothetical protein
MATEQGRKTAVVTGASAGIGAATARQLAAAGYTVYAGARRVDRVEALAEEIGGVAHPLDVSDQASVDAFCAQVPAALDLLVNNAGGALGLDPVETAKDEDWERMYASNVLGLMKMTRALLPNLREGRGHIVNITSVAAREVYQGGAGYTAVKHAARAVTETLRLELNGEPIRVTDLAPGMTETEFSEVRFSGDAERAKKVYEGLTPLTAEDIAECVVFVASRPWHVNIDELVIRPVAQARTFLVARGKGL